MLFLYVASRASISACLSKTIFEYPQANVCPRGLIALFSELCAVNSFCRNSLLIMRGEEKLFLL